MLLVLIVLIVVLVFIQVLLVLPVLLQVLVVRGKQYRVIKLLGKGDSSRVYKAFNEHRNSVVAIKRVNLEEADEATTEWGYSQGVDCLSLLAPLSLLLAPCSLLLAPGSWLHHSNGNIHRVWIISPSLLLAPGSLLLDPPR